MIRGIALGIGIAALFTACASKTEEAVPSVVAPSGASSDALTGALQTAPTAPADTARPAHPALPAVTAQTVQGEARPLFESGAKATLLVFWRTNCAVCRKETPHVVDLHRDYAARGLRVVGVNVGESAGDIETFNRQFGVAHETRIVTAADCRDLLSFTGTPMVYLLDAQGGVVASGRSLPERAAIEALLP